LKAFDRDYNFALKLPLIGVVHKKLWASKIVKVLISKISGLPTWEAWDKMTFGYSFMVNHKEYYKGESGGFPPSLSHVESCESCESCESEYAHGSSMHQKCSNYTLINLLFGLCRSMWIIDPFVVCPSPHLGVLVQISYPWNVTS
jgi:hypothetical protein